MTGIVGPGYHLNHRKADVQRAVNLMPIAHEVGGGKSIDYLDSVPGLSSFSTPVSATGALLTEASGYLLYESSGKILLDAP